jgi:uncharacterized protein
MPKTMPKTSPKKTKTTTKSVPRSNPKPAYRLRRSPVHGTGMFATRAIRKGGAIIEYVGERISHAEADRRHADKAEDDNHTFLFTVDRKTVIDGGVQGNASRFINHSCEPNCEVILDDGRLFIEALRSIKPGEEILYDYNISRGPGDSPEVDRIFGCRCGAASCRGTMMAPRKKKKSAKKKAGGRKPKNGAASKTRRAVRAQEKRTPAEKKASGRKPKNGAASKTRGAVRAQEKRTPAEKKAAGAKPKNGAASKTRRAVRA